jgi:glycosyltransferase involved in cell wall biosynthesis
LIGIIEAVRSRGHDVSLEIIGDEDYVAGQEYITELNNRIAQAGDWVRLHQSVSRAELEQLVSACRFGIHGMLEEHFGIAPAELMRAGCLVFVPNSGGQVEIVGEHPELRYDTDADAVEKICAVLADRDLESGLRQKLGSRADAFSENSFMTNIRKAVMGFYREIQ